MSEPNPGLANLLLEQFGGPQGELAATGGRLPLLHVTGGRLPLLHARFKR
ncbi:hypothetical protein LTSEHVI_0425 [Salmonella enterica subsp. enterica serovar Hvittingfoss str. A4-620]|nr:hypothetical protein LTSEHVI_0425 [Salmonella enterica subsp. enterica serovar Hvittingfoss str. A4-620]